MSDGAETQLRPSMGGFCPRCGGPMDDGRCRNPLCTPQPTAPPTTPPPGGDSSRPSFLMLALVALGSLALVVIGAVAINALRSGSDATQPVAETQTSGSGATVTTTRAPGGSGTTATGPRKLTMGPEARICTAGNGSAYSEVWAGVTGTSCEFSNNVAAAYRAASPSTTQVRTMRVHSPVTNLDYDVTCEPTSPVRCTTDTGATVYVMP